MYGNLSQAAGWMPTGATHQSGAGALWGGGRGWECDGHFGAGDHVPVWPGRGEGGGGGCVAWALNASWQCFSAKWKKTTTDHWFLLPQTMCHSMGSWREACGQMSTLALVCQEEAMLTIRQCLDVLVFLFFPCKKLIEGLSLTPLSSRPYKSCFGGPRGSEAVART